DFKDIFEARGTSRPRRGTRLDPHLEPAVVELSYTGLDAVVRTVRLSWDPQPLLLTARAAAFEVVLEPQRPVTIDLTVECVEGDRVRPFQATDESFAALIVRDDDQRQHYAILETSDARFN